MMASQYNPKEMSTVHEGCTRCFSFCGWRTVSALPSLREGPGSWNIPLPSLSCFLSDCVITGTEVKIGCFSRIQTLTPSLLLVILFVVQEERSLLFYMSLKTGFYCSSGDLKFLCIAWTVDFIFFIFWTVDFKFNLTPFCGYIAKAFQNLDLCVYFLPSLIIQVYIRPFTQVHVVFWAYFFSLVLLTVSLLFSCYQNINGRLRFLTSSL